MLKASDVKESFKKQIEKNLTPKDTERQESVNEEWKNLKDVISESAAHT